MRFLFAIIALLPAATAQAETLVLAGGGETLAVEVAEATPFSMNDRPALEFALTEASSTAMSDLTARMVGQDLTVSLCGIELVRATVRDRISGRGVIDMPSVEAAAAALDEIRSRVHWPWPK